MSKDFYSAILNRRSFYAISKKSPISDNKIEEVIGHAIKHTPSAFNSQSSKVVLLFGEQHDKLWDIVMETLRQKVPANKLILSSSLLESIGTSETFATVAKFQAAWLIINPKQTITAAVISEPILEN